MEFYVSFTEIDKEKLRKGKIPKGTGDGEGESEVILVARNSGLPSFKKWRRQHRNRSVIARENKKLKTISESKTTTTKKEESEVARPNSKKESRRKLEDKSYEIAARENKMSVLGENTYRGEHIADFTSILLENISKKLKSLKQELNSTANEDEGIDNLKEVEGQKRAMAGKQAKRFEAIAAADGRPRGGSESSAMTRPRAVSFADDRGLPLTMEFRSSANDEARRHSAPDVIQTSEEKSSSDL